MTYSFPLSNFPANPIACWVPNTSQGLVVDGSNNVVQWQDVIGGYALTVLNQSYKPTFNPATGLITMGPGAVLLMSSGFPSVAQPFTVCMYAGFQNWVSFDAIWTSTGIRAYMNPPDGSNHATWAMGGYAATDTGYTLGVPAIALLWEVPSVANFNVYDNGNLITLGGHSAGGLGTSFVLHASDLSGSNSGNTMIVGGLAIFGRQLSSSEKAAINAWLPAPLAPVPTLASWTGNIPSDDLVKLLVTESSVPFVKLLGIMPGISDISSFMQTQFNAYPALQFSPYKTYTFQHQITQALCLVEGNQATINIAAGYTPVSTRMWNASPYPEIDFVVRPGDNGQGYVPMQSAMQMVVNNLIASNTNNIGTLLPNTIPTSQVSGFYPALYLTTSYGNQNPVAGGTHASFTIQKCGAYNFYFGYLLSIAQYDLIEDCRAGNCQVGIAVMPHYQNGGGIDLSVRSCIGYNNNIFIALWHISTNAALAFNDARIEDCHNNTGTTHYHFYSHWWRLNNSYGNGGPNYLIRCASEYLAGDSGLEFVPQNALYYPQYDPAPPAWASAVTVSNSNGNYIKVPMFSGVVVNEGTDLYVLEYVCNDSQPIAGIFRGGPYSRTFITSSGGGGQFYQWVARADDPTALFYFEGVLNSFGRANNVAHMPDQWGYWMDHGGQFSPFTYLQVSGWIEHSESVNAQTSISTAVIVTPRTPAMVGVNGMTFNINTTIVDTVGPFSGKTVRRIVTGTSTGSYAISYVQACSNGIGYQVNDVLTLTGGTFSIAAQVTVTSVNASGAVTGVSLTNPGSYSVALTPNNGSGYLAASVTGGHGSGATIGYILGGINASTPRIESPFANNGNGIYADNGQTYAGTWGMIWVRTLSSAPQIMVMCDINNGAGWANLSNNCAGWQVLNPGEWTAFVIMRSFHNDDLKFGFILPPNTPPGLELRFTAFAGLGKGGLDSQVLQKAMSRGLWNPMPYANATGLAATGNSQNTAYPMYARVNQFTTVAANTGALLWPLSADDQVTVINQGANALSIYPPFGGMINNLGLNAPASLASGKAAIFRCQDMLNFSCVGI